MTHEEEVEAQRQDQQICPLCHREFEPQYIWCPYDGAPLRDMNEQDVLKRKKKIEDEIKKKEAQNGHGQ